MHGVSLTISLSFECPASLVFLMPCFEQILTASKSNQGSETPALSQLLSNLGVHCNHLKGFVHPRYLGFTPRFSNLVAWGPELLYPTFWVNVNVLALGLILGEDKVCSLRIPSMWQSLQLTEAQRPKICEFLNGCFFWTILKRQDCVSLLFGVQFIIFRSITLVGHLCKLTNGI